MVSKTFHGAGIVVPVDKNSVGYRELPESDGNALPYTPYTPYTFSLCTLIYSILPVLYTPYNHLLTYNSLPSLFPIPNTVCVCVCVAGLKRICKAIVEAGDDDERMKAFAPLQEMMTFVQFANDECDYGMGFELGIDLFCYGSHVRSSHTIHTHSTHTQYILIMNTQNTCTSDTCFQYTHSH